jgi:antitoxin (DNA-binding transcriptional repressor) of toxin-antitoxin stability system
MAMMMTVEGREDFADVINRTTYGKERVILTRRGKPLAACAVRMSLSP